MAPSLHLPTNVVVNILHCSTSFHSIVHQIVIAGLIIISSMTVSSNLARLNAHARRTYLLASGLCFYSHPCVSILRPNCCLRCPLPSPDCTQSVRVARRSFAVPLKSIMHSLSKARLYPFPRTLSSLPVRHRSIPVLTALRSGTSFICITDCLDEAVTVYRVTCSSASPSAPTISSSNAYTCTVALCPCFLPSSSLITTTLYIHCLTFAPCTHPRYGGDHRSYPSDASH